MLGTTELDRVFVVLACGLLLASGVIGLRPLLVVDTR